MITVLLNYDPFAGGELWRLFDRASEPGRRGRAWSGMPMDVVRSGDHFLAAFDLPGIDPGSIDVSVEGNTLTVRALRSAPTSQQENTQDVEWLVTERPRGTYSRQLMLGDDLDLERLEATYTDGVLTLSIPVAEKAKPRQVTVTHGTSAHERSALTGRAHSGDQAGT